MSNGGYKGQAPARETSPEQYPGVWELTEQFQAQAAGNWPFQADDCAPKSLRLRASASAYLSKTPAAAGNRKTWTWSGWVKRGSLTTNNPVVFSADTGNAPWTAWQFTQSDGTIQITTFAGTSPGLLTNASFRDPSAWYHIVIAMDTTQATASDRVKLYVNGEQQTFSNTNYPALNSDTKVNGAYNHYIGYTNNQFFDGELSEVHLIDGQALSCEEFGFFNGQGIWSPKRFTGDYSNAPVFSSSSDANGVVASGSLVNLFDGDTSTAVQLSQSNTDYAIATQGQAIPVATTIGFYTQTGASNPTLRVTTIEGNVTVLDYNDATIVNGGWTDFSFTGTVAKIEVGYIAGSGSSNNFYGLRVDGEWLRDATVGRNSFKLDFSDTSSDAALGKDSSGLGNDWSVTNITAAGLTMNQSQTWSTYGSTSSGGTASGLGLERGFNGDVTNQTEGDTTGAYFSIPFNTTIASGDVGFVAYSSGGSGHMKLYNGSTEVDDVTSSGNSQFRYSTYVGAITEIRISRDNRAFEFAAVSVFGEVLVDAGVSDPTLANIDSFFDSPVNGNEASTGAGGQRRGNYATLNPLAFSSLTLVNGNLQTSGGGSAWLSAFSTIKTPESGKWFYECKPLGGNSGIIGIFKDLPQTNTYIGDQKESYGWYGATGNTSKGPGNTQVSYNSGATFTTNDVIGVALDLDAGTLTFYKNGTSQGVAFSGLSGSFYFAVSRYNGDMLVNFGQRAFEHPVSGFSPLATSFLPEPTIKRGDQHMDVALWVGNGNGVTIQNFPFSPDLCWIKNRDSGSYGHRIVDKVRGATYRLQPHANSAQGQETTGLTAFNSDGFEVGSAQDYNYNNNNHLAWMWDAGEATTTIAAGGSNSSAYNQSQVWSTYGTNTGTTFNPAISQLFDNDLTTGPSTPAATSATWTFTSGLTASSSIEIYCVNGSGPLGTQNSGTEIRLTVDGTVHGINGAPGWIDTGLTGTLTAITIFVTASSGSSGLRAIKVDGKELVDAINDSQTWSNGLNGLSGSTITNATNGFDTDESSYADSTAGFTLDLSGHTFGTGAHTIEVKSGGATSFSVNGSTSLTDPGGGGAKVWTGTHTGELTSLASSATGASVYYIKIDGKYLANPGQNYVTNVPEVECKVRANQAAGFSIVKVDNPTDTQGRVHGLSKAPEFFICKSLGSADSWHTYWKELGKDYYINIYPIGSKASSDQFGSQEPNSVSYYVKANTGSGANKSGGMIYYLWHSVEGYSKFSSYTGTGGDVFVYCGFRPRVITIKNADQSNNWLTYDTARDTTNPADASIQWDYSYNDTGITNDSIDILSNGFMIKASRNDLTGNGHKILFGAWAEHPFASNCRAR